jgi:hypothetical protein
MNAPDAIDAFDSPAPSEERPETPLERQAARLERLAEAGMELVEALTAQARGTGPKVVDGDVGLAFSRVSRAVRMAILLHHQLSQGAADSAKAAEEAGRRAEAERKKAHVARAVRIVERVAMDHCQVEPSRIGDYVYAARERLEDDDIYGLAAARPVGELVAMICRDFGLEPDWDALEQEAWAQAEIASGAEGSPFLMACDDEDPGDEDPGDGEASEPDPEPQVLTPRTFRDRLTVLAQDPLILAAARRDTG